MALLNLAEATKRYNNPLVEGVAQTIVDNDPLMGQLPWLPIAGDTQKVNWEVAMGGAGPTDVNAAITDEQKAASEVETKFYTLRTYTAQAEIADLVAATSESAGVDPMAYELESKAKNLGTQYSKALAGVDTRSNIINSLKSQAGVSQDWAGADFGLDTLDAVCNALKGRVDFITLDRAKHTKFKQLLRAQGGATETVVVLDPYTGEERTVLAFEGIPVFLNDYYAAETAAGLQAGEAGYTAPTGANIRGSVYAGRFDGGSKKEGVAMIFPSARPAGLVVQPVGQMEGKVAEATRLVQHLNFVNFNKYGLARVFNVK